MIDRICEGFIEPLKVMDGPQPGGPRETVSLACCTRLWLSVSLTSKEPNAKQDSHRPIGAELLTPGVEARLCPIFVEGSSGLFSCISLKRHPRSNPGEVANYCGACILPVLRTEWKTDRA